MYTVNLTYNIISWFLILLSFFFYEQEQVEETTGGVAYSVEIPRYSSGMSTMSTRETERGYFDPWVTEDVAPLLFSGCGSDGWRDTNVAMRVLSRKYGAREHHVTLVSFLIPDFGRLLLRRH